MRYEFIVTGTVSEVVLTALPELSATASPAGGTALFGPVRDHADVATVLARFSDLGIRVVEMRQLPD
jgi:hypothetical protein